MCSKKGEKVSTPLDKDGRDPRGLITHMRQLSPTSGQPYFYSYLLPGRDGEDSIAATHRHGPVAVN